MMSKLTQEDVIRQVVSDGQGIAKQYLSAATDNVMLKAEEVSYNNFMAKEYLNDAANHFVGLKTYANTGQFCDLSHGDWQSISLRDAYLAELGKEHSGYNSFYNNIDAFNNLYSQNGPKRMKHRLERFLLRIIKHKAGVK